LRASCEDHAVCVYHQSGVDLLADVIDNKNILFGSEMGGAVSGIVPPTGFYFDDTKRYIDTLDIGEVERHVILEGNARRVFPPTRCPATHEKPIVEFTRPCSHDPTERNGLRSQTFNARSKRLAVLTAC